MDQTVPPPATPCGAARSAAADSAQREARLEQQVRRCSDNIEVLRGQLEQKDKRLQEAEDESIKKSGELAAAQNSILQLEEEAEERDLSTAEEFELEELQKKEAQYLAVLEKAQAELDELVGHVEVQPPNTTKLGFTIQIKHGFGEHCQWHKCKRSACF